MHSWFIRSASCVCCWFVVVLFAASPVMSWRCSSGSFFICWIAVFCSLSVIWVCWMVFAHCAVSPTRVCGRFSRKMIVSGLGLVFSIASVMLCWCSCRVSPSGSFMVCCRRVKPCCSVSVRFCIIVWVQFVPVIPSSSCWVVIAGLFTSPFIAVCFRV